MCSEVYSTWSMCVCVSVNTIPRLFVSEWGLVITDDSVITDDPVITDDSLPLGDGLGDGLDVVTLLLLSVTSGRQREGPGLTSQM